MTLRTLLDEIHKMALEDGELDDEVIVEDILDYCALAGVDGASEAYANTVIRGVGCEGSD